MGGMFGMFPCVRIYRYWRYHNVERMGRLINWLLGKRMYGLKLQVRPSRLDPEQYPRSDLEIDLSSDLKVDLRLDLRLDHFVFCEISRHTTSYVVCRLLRLNGF